MRINCPYCGERDIQEFAYLGAADPRRPDPRAADAGAAFHRYVYLRDNPAGRHRELWYHQAGCRMWLEVDRNTVTHEQHGARIVRQETHEALAKEGGR